MKKLESMKQFFLLTVFLIGFQSRGAESAEIAETDIRTCGIVNSEYNLMKGELSDYWAQELIGSDLLREELKEIPPPSQTNFISIFDDGSHHAHNVRYLISGPGDYAILPELGDKISFKTVISGKYSVAVSQLKEAGEIPSFINHSMSWLHKEITYESFKSLSPYSLVVTASGNNFPETLNTFQSQASSDFNAIVVGSFSPLGFVSGFSQEGEEVWILAPSDDYITSASFDGGYSSFGGTSGAAPLVTGALAGFEWISTYHPTAEEAKILLSKTAIPTLHSQYEQPQRNGKGLLNAYKLGHVAKRLKDKCQKNQTENQVDEDCFQKEIRNEENYLFPYSSLKDDEFGLTLSQTFPSCSFFEKSLTDKPHYPNCDEKADVFKRLKRQVLLSPERKELWEHLSCIYMEAGFSSNALMLDRIALALTPTNSLGNEFLNQILPLFKESHREYYRLRLLIGQALLDEGREEELFALSQSTNEDIRFSLVSIASMLRGEVRSNLLRQLVQNTDGNVRKAVAYSAGKTGGELGFNLLKQLIQDPDSKVRKAVAYSAGKIGGEWGFNLLNQLIQYPDVREFVALAAGDIGEELGFNLLNQLIQNTDDEVRKAVAYSAGKIGGEWGFNLLNQLIQYPNVREFVALAAGDIGGELGFKLLKQLIKEPDYNVIEAVAYSAGRIGDLGLSLLNKLIKEPDYNVISAITIAAGDIGGELGFKLLNKLVQDQDTDGEIKATVAYSAGKIGGELGFKLLNKLALDTDGNVREGVAIAAGNIGGELGFKLLKQLVQDPYSNVREDVAYSARNIGEEDGFKLLNKLVQDTDGNVRRAVAYSAGNIGGELGFKLLKQLVQDPYSNVRWTVARMAGKFGEEVSLILLNQLALDPNLDVREVAIAEIAEISQNK